MRKATRRELVACKPYPRNESHGPGAGWCGVRHATRALTLMMRWAQRHDGRPAMRGWSVNKLWACVGIITLGCVTPLSITAHLVCEEAFPLAATVPTQNSADAPAEKSRV